MEMLLATNVMMKLLLMNITCCTVRLGYRLASTYRNSRKPNYNLKNFEKVTFPLMPSPSTLLHPARLPSHHHASASAFMHMFGATSHESGVEASEFPSKKLWRHFRGTLVSRRWLAGQKVAQFFPPFFFFLPYGN